MTKTDTTYAAPCGWTCTRDDKPEPAVERAIEALKAAGLRAVIVYQDPSAPPDEADFGAAFTHDDALADCQAFASEAAGYLCHLSRVCPVVSDQS